MLGDVVQALAELLGKCSHRHLALALERVDQTNAHGLAQHPQALGDDLGRLGIDRTGAMEIPHRTPPLTLVCDLDRCLAKWGNRGFQRRSRFALAPAATATPTGGGNEAGVPFTGASSR